jgi:HupE / UreJ protein
VRAALTLAVLASVGLGPTRAGAHQLGVSYSELTIGDRTVDGRVVLAAADAAALARDPRVLLDTLSLLQDGTRCSLAPGDVTPEGGDGVALTGRWTCPARIDRLQIRVGFVEAMPRGHTHLAKVVSGGEVHERVVRAGADAFEVAGPPRLAAQAARFLALGVEHILTGYDHVAFLFGLLLLGGSLRSLVAVVTSFTVAHSITLALATLGAVTPPARIVEPLIAASIVFVAGENLWALRHGAAPGASADAARRRWVVAFAFGLVHGFGFASVLAQLRLPRSGLAASLVAFNVGVETGQIAIVAAAFPLLALARRSAGFVPHGVRLGSLAIGSLGLFWLVQRAAWPG